MTDDQKEKIIETIKYQLPESEESRIEVLLNLILIEIDASNSCAAEIDWEKLGDIVSEILYQKVNGEMDAGITAVKRGDTSISYQSTTASSQSLIAGYHDLINRILGCSDGLEFF
ncbi:hypothetical protein [Enterococcus massiliensis]|uniref:hypothetical protein n=1 Tax=Enterococcus massiliensis TaxID=1640685 RepID=UPI00065E3906|nr:hypothetical protein [Enterococcus massiliensis]